MIKRKDEYELLVQNDDGEAIMSHSIILVHAWKTEENIINLSQDSCSSSWDSNQDIQMESRCDNSIILWQ
jgi:hypothetical protein